MVTDQLDSLIKRVTSIDVTKRINRVTHYPEGYVAIKSIIPTTIWRLIERYAELLGVVPAQAYKIFLDRIALLIEEGDPKFFDFLGLDIKSTINSLTGEEKFVPDNSPKIDISLLEQDVKIKSGFTGVYPNGKSFRATAPKSKSDKSVITIATCPTPEMAAWKRYLHFKKEGLKYGDEPDVMAEIAKVREMAFVQTKDETDLWVMQKVVNPDRKSRGLSEFTEDDLKSTKPIVEPQEKPLGGVDESLFDKQY
jgi:hypothetical protein